MLRPRGHNRNNLTVTAVVTATPVARRDRDYRVTFFVAWQDANGQDHRLRVSTRGKLAHDCKRNLMVGDKVIILGELLFRQGYYTVRAAEVNHLLGDHEVLQIGKTRLLKGGSALYDVAGYAAADLKASNGLQTMKVLVNLPRVSGGDRLYAFYVPVQQDVRSGCSVTLRGELFPGFKSHEGTNIMPPLKPQWLAVSSPIVRHPEDERPMPSLDTFSVPA